MAKHQAATLFRPYAAGIGTTDTHPVAGAFDTVARVN